MPKLEEMAQLSRPFQIALVAVCLLFAVWLFALQGHSSSPTATPAPASSAPSSSASSESAAAEAKAAAAPTPVYHGSAPGVEGLTRAINKAHGAVATSQEDAKRLEGKSAQASGEPTSTSGSSASAGSPSTASSSSSSSKPATHSTAAAAPVTHTSTSTSTTSAAAGATVNQQPSKSQPGAASTPARQAAVERALKEGKVAVILFWNPKGADDIAVNDELIREPQVRRAVERSGLELTKKFAAFVATASEVSAFGSITRGVQVQATPAIVIVNKQGQATVLPGLQDAYSIEQAIDEARDS
jgi:hypothetical protein